MTSMNSIENKVYLQDVKVIRVTPMRHNVCRKLALWTFLIFFMSVNEQWVKWKHV